jgi:hypothetical protein
MGVEWASLSNGVTICDAAAGTSSTAASSILVVDLTVRMASSG